MSGAGGNDRKAAQAERERLDELLDAALAATFPASDAIAIDAASLRAQADAPVAATDKRPPPKVEP
jgi:hypothetical protein